MDSGQIMMVSIFALHCLVLLAAYVRTIRQPPDDSGTRLFGDVVGIISIFVAPMFGIWMLNSSGGEHGAVNQWYLIMSMITFGGLPLLSLTSFAMLGRILGRARVELRKYASRRKDKLDELYNWREAITGPMEDGSLKRNERHSMATASRPYRPSS